MLSACAQQAPAPVINGYQKDNLVKGVSAGAAANPNVPYSLTRNTSQASVKEEDLQNIEPAAGPSGGGAAPRSFVADWTEKPVTNQGVVTHTVQPGETVYRLARRYNTTPAEILKQNQMSSTSDLASGRQILIPSGSKTAVAPVVVPVAEVSHPVLKTAQNQQNMMRGGAKPSQPVVAEAPARLLPPPGPQPVVAAAPQPMNPDPAPVALEARDTSDVADIEPAAGPKADAPRPAEPEVKMVSHKVKAGETVYRIAHQYGASVLDVMSANQFNQPQDLKAGTVVKVPVQEKAAAEDKQKSIAKVEDETAESKPVPPKTAVDEVKAAFNKGKIDPVAARARGMAWPVQGQVIRRFGAEGNGVAHAGINIAVPPNTPVLAADEGTVMYAGSGLKTYGNLVLIKHPDGLVGAYAHNNQLLVTKGEAVKKGQVIALSGASGNVDKPQLHFELRRNARAVDPTTLLAAQ